MNFLFPAMLAGLASLSLPVILHLIARQRFPVLDFPTIRLLQGENRTNTLAQSWSTFSQTLLLRLLVLTLLILAMARLFAPWISSKPAAHDTVIVIDGSASMMQIVDDPVEGKISLFNLAKKRAEKILKELDAPSRASVIVAGGSTDIMAPLEPGHEHALAVLDGAKPYDACGSGLVEAVASCLRQLPLLQPSREVASQIIVLSDLRKSSFEYRSESDTQRIRDARDELGDSLHVVFVDLAPNATENLGITRTPDV